MTEICRKAGISQATYFNWKRRYDGLLPTEMRRLKQLEDENGKLKRIVADLSLDNLRPVRKWKLVNVVAVNGMCRSGELAGLLKSIPRPISTNREDPNRPAWENRIKEICQTPVRYGYRRVHLLLRREGWPLGQNKARRIYRELGLQLRNKTPKRRVRAKLRDDRREATQPNETWATDLCTTNWQLVTRSACWPWSICSRVTRSPFQLCAENVVQTLDGTCAGIASPKTIRVDQGTEFVSHDLDLWAYTNGVTLDFSRPGKPTDNAFIEAFNGRFRTECLNTYWLLTVRDARSKLEDWRRYYNEERPHRLIGQRPRLSTETPIALDETSGARVSQSCNPQCHQALWHFARSASSGRRTPFAFLRSS